MEALQTPWESQKMEEGGEQRLDLRRQRSLAIKTRYNTILLAYLKVLILARFDLVLACLLVPWSHRLHHTLLHLQAVYNQLQMAIIHIVVLPRDLNLLHLHILILLDLQFFHLCQDNRHKLLLRCHHNRNVFEQQALHQREQPKKPLEQ